MQNNISISRGHVLREWLPLVALAFSTFIFNTSEFIPIGLLSDIAADFAITESKAGVLITVYAWVVAIASLPLMLMVSGTESKRLMLGIFGLFVISHVGSALSTGYYMLMLSRIGVACSHAIFWSIVTPLAVKIAPKGRGSIALSIIVAGSSIAMIAGLPLGRAIGLAAGWRMTFLLIGCVAFAVMLLIAAVLPRTQGEKAFSLKQLPDLLRTPSLPGIYLVTVLSVTAHFTGYSYIEPFLAQIAGFKAGSITMILTLFGITGIIGSLLFSRYFDSHRSFFMRYAVIGIGCCLLLLRPAAMTHQTVVTLCIFWGLANRSRRHVHSHVHLLRNLQCRHRQRGPYRRSGLLRNQRQRDRLYRRSHKHRGLPLLHHLPPAPPPIGRPWHKKGLNRAIQTFFVPGTGLEPAQPCGH